MHSGPARIVYAALCTWFASACGGVEPEIGTTEHELTWAETAATCGCTKLTVTPTSTIRVRAGGDLQAAINKATSGAEIVLDAGATYTGNFELPKKSGTAYITIRTVNTTASCERITPADAPKLARIVARSGAPAFKVLSGAHHWRLLNLEVRGPSGAYAPALIELGTGFETSTSAQPSYIVLDRLYVHGDAKAGGKRGVSLNSRYTTIQNSWIADFKSTTQDSQAIAGWNGAGNWTIANNYLQAAGENILIGGTDPKVSGLVPSNIKIRFNHIEKSRTWRPGDSTYAGTKWIVKNLLELKNAKSVTIEGNTFEYNWPGAQKGWAIVLTPRNQGGAATWTKVAYVTFRRNVVRHVAAGINILGHDDMAKSQLTTNITIQDNLFDDIGGTWGGTSSAKGRTFQLVSGTSEPGPSYVTIDHNTAMGASYYLLGVGLPGDAVAKPGFTFTNQMIKHGSGVYGDGADGTAQALATSFPSAVIKANAFIGGSSSSYSKHPGNYFPSSTTSVGFKSDGSYELASASSYNNKGTDGKDLGASYYYLDEASQCE
jgi:hypothetical protein